MNETTDNLAISHEGPPALPEADSGDLPMVVWLRGDEPYCGDFALDAEAVMLQIGIKRTRLTQISGRELRVGRIRRGRYIVPVYRPEDVQEYLNWTRATATQHKSSQVVEQAAQHLRSAGDQIEQRLEEAQTRLLEQVDHAILSVSRFFQGELLPKVRQLAALLDEIEGRQERLEALVTRLRTEMDQALGRAMQDQLKGLGALQLLTQDLADLKARVAAQEERREGQRKALSEHLAQIDRGLAAMLERVSVEPLSPLPPRPRPNRWYGRRWTSGQDSPETLSRPGQVRRPLKQGLRRRTETIIGDTSNAKKG